MYGHSKSYSGTGPMWSMSYKIYLVLGPFFGGGNSEWKESTAIRPFIWVIAIYIEKGRVLTRFSRSDKDLSNYIKFCVFVSTEKWFCTMSCYSYRLIYTLYQNAFMYVFIAYICIILACIYRNRHWGNSNSLEFGPFLLNQNYASLFEFW